jgi:hypothetical protein
MQTVKITDQDLAWERISQEMKDSGSWLSSFETISAPEFKLARKNGCIQCYISSCPLLLHRLNHRHIMTGSVLFSDIAEVNEIKKFNRVLSRTSTLTLDDENK